MTGRHGRWCPFHCTVEQLTLITRRARRAGMSRSEFMVACALYDRPDGLGLLVRAQERKAVLDQLSAAAEVAVRLRTPVPDLGMSVLDARASEDGVSDSDFIVKAAIAIDPPPVARRTRLWPWTGNGTSRRRGIG
ncbi:MAG: hypothetical protein OXD40_02030 [bacterium]|nr:hypothetical protein [bacterium]